MKKRSAIKIFFSVVYALFLREIQTRFGAQKLGYLWMLVEPMSTIVVFALIKELLHPNALPGISYPVFLASGFIAYNMFKSIVVRSLNAFDANKGLFVYKQVKPFDAIVSRVIVEIFITTLVVAVFVFIGWYLDLEIECKNLLGVLAGYIMLVLMGFSWGVLFATLGYFFENFKKIVNLMFLPLFFLSAIFYTLDSLPPLAKEILLFNPLVHFMEFIHGNYFYSLDTHNVNFSYMTFWTLVPLFLGLWLYKRSEKKIIMS